jgi:hypothetical protein
MTQPIEIPPTTPIAPATDTAQFRLAYEQTAADRAALADEDVLTPSFDLTSAVHIAVGALNHIAGLRPQMDGLPVDVTVIDRVGLYAHAAGYAHALFVINAEPPPEQQAVYEAALQARLRLRSDASNLALYGIVNADALDGLKGDTGHRNVGYDVLSLVAIHRAAQSRSAGRTAIAPEALEEYDVLASRLLDMVAKRETQLKEQSDVVNQRRRAATLLIHAYDEAQRAVAFLRWKQGDADKLTPSLFAAKGAGRPPKPPAQESDSTTDAAPAPNGSASAPLPAATQGDASAPTTPEVPVGARGGSPYR